MSRNNLLITGTGGFIFGNFIRQAIYTKQNYNLTSLDKIRKTHTLHNIFINKNHQFYPCDITDPHFVNVVFEVAKPDVVVHGAAMTHVDDSISNGYDFVKNNVLGTQVIIDACIKWNVNKLIYISSDEVYGHLNETDSAWTEDSPTNPRNPYSASKLSGELLVKAAHETHGLNYIITRASNNYGPWQDTSKLIPKVIKCIINNDPIPIYGQGMQMREWTHVFDNCSALFKIINDGDINTIYNISSGQEFRNIEVVQQIANIIGKGHDLITFVDDRPGHDFRYSINCDKLKNIGWNPLFKFKDGLEQTVNWYLANKWALKF